MRDGTSAGKRLGADKVIGNRYALNYGIRMTREFTISSDIISAHTGPMATYGHFEPAGWPWAS